MRKVICIFILLCFFISPLSFGYYHEFIGKRVTLTSAEDAAVVHVGAHKPGFNAAIGTLADRDPQSYMAVYLSHNCFEVDVDTRAILLEVVFFEHAAKVRILEGTYAGREGWVLLEQVVGY